MNCLQRRKYIAIGKSITLPDSYRYQLRQKNRRLQLCKKCSCSFYNRIESRRNLRNKGLFFRLVHDKAGIKGFSDLSCTLFYSRSIFSKTGILFLPVFVSISSQFEPSLMEWSEADFDKIGHIWCWRPSSIRYFDQICDWNFIFSVFPLTLFSACRKSCFLSHFHRYAYAYLYCNQWVNEHDNRVTLV